MMGRHRLLHRQMAAYLGDEGAWPAPLRQFVGAVNAAYHQSDLDRTLLERSLELSSQELLQANSELRAVVEAFPDLFLWLAPDGRILGCRGQDTDDLLLPLCRLVGKRLQEVPDADAAAGFARALEAVRAGESLVTVEYQLRRQDEVRTYEARLRPLADGRVLAIIRNISDRRRAEAALAEREAQLRQAQKMEAVGLLAGGIAHDFNNLLTAIGGYADLILESGECTPAIRRRIQEIGRAAESATALTRQLLAFSRQQILQPQTVDLNAIVLRTDSLLRRVIGEDIELLVDLASPLDLVTVDPCQIEQIVLNLAVNARDAMPRGGRLMLGTSRVWLDDAAAAAHEGAHPGPHVVLTVSDTGSGMDAETRAHIFEPFFTTKPRGEGTGLGLATVYGIVRQSGGWIDVESEPGHGTTFRIYFPPAAPGAGPTKARAEVEPAPDGMATILLAEDQPEVRSVACEMLTDHGYTVLAASSGDEALALADRSPRAIDLLLTDVVMPHMSGPELVERLHARHPDIRVLYASGYADEAIVRHGVVPPHMAFLQKPFTTSTLLTKVREVLGARCVEPA